MRIYTKVAMSALTMLLCVGMMAQKGEGKERRAQIEAKKIAYCNEEAGLTTAEAEKYWATEAALKEEKKALRKSGKDLRDLDLDSASEQEIEAAIKSGLEAKIKAKELELAYVDKQLQAISAKKLALVKKAERSFQKEVLRDLKGRGERPEARPERN